MANEQVAPRAREYQCKSCEGFFGANDFYASNLSNCKECVKARVRERARTNPSVQEYDRERSKLPHRKANSARVAEMWNKRNPDAYRAHYLASNAVRDGRLQKQPCLFCGAERVHAHHRDYGRPLDVIWLCPKCHHRLHANFPETEGVNKGG